MSQLTINCPHCHTKSVSFSSFSEIQKPNNRYLFVTSFYCGNCYGGYIAEILSKSGSSVHSTKGNIQNNESFLIEKGYPLPKNISTPKYLPKNINTFFLQAMSSLQSKNFDASSIMSRKVLEVAVKTLNPNGEGSLYKRIEQLSELGKITVELKEWAHIIRDNGNDAVHEEEPVTPEFAEELLSFSEMFLMYTFTMPGMVASRRHNESIEK